ncbi:MAG: hypothetical protein PUB42_04015 [Firmicutes bacterium]|nr:hypothetical protein [Bacillota bacterium]
MIKEFKKTLAYICPFCSIINYKDVSLFDFSDSKPAVFACKGVSCRDDCITVAQKKDKYSITVTCPVCDGYHTFNISKIHFWQSPFLALHCPETGIGIFFAGDKARVQHEIEQQEELFAQFQDEYTIGDELNTIFEIVERINTLANEGNVTCSCGSKMISIEIDNEKITLRCRTCDKTKEIPANADSLDMLLNTSAIVLD